MDAFDSGTLMDRLGIEIVSCTREETILTMPVEGNTQIRGVLHGGASATLDETAASAAAYCHVMAERDSEGVSRVPVATDLSISFVRPGRGRRVTACARAVHLGRTRTVHEVRITSDTDQVLAIATVANQLVAERSER